MAKLHADVQILNKGVASKQNLLYINFKSRFPTTNASNRPWYIHINSSFESLFWKLSIDSLSWFSAQFPVFPFWRGAFFLPLGTLPILVPASSMLKWRYLVTDFRQISPQHSRNNEKWKCVGKFWYVKYLSRGVHLRNTPRVFLATPT